MKRENYNLTAGRLDTVGVAGSTPVEPTIFFSGLTDQIIEIPNEYEVVPAVRWTDGHPTLFRCLVKKRSLGSEIGVKPVVAAKKRRGRPRKVA